MPLPGCFFGLFVSHPVLQCLGYVKAVFRALVRKLQLTRRGETKRLIPPFFQGLMALHYAYTTEEELRTAAATVDGFQYTYGGGVGGSEFWEGSCPLGVYGPYDFLCWRGLLFEWQMPRRRWGMASLMTGKNVKVGGICRSQGAEALRWYFAVKRARLGWGWKRFAEGFWIVWLSMHSLDVSNSSFFVFVLVPVDTPRRLRERYWQLASSPGRRQWR
eukprot:scaffold1679_cov40-Cyclotella_meneghiniana.AAC.1